VGYKLLFLQHKLEHNNENLKHRAQLPPPGFAGCSDGSKEPSDFFWAQENPGKMVRWPGGGAPDNEFLTSADVQ